MFLKVPTQIGDRLFQEVFPGFSLLLLTSGFVVVVVVVVVVGRTM